MNHIPDQLDLWGNKNELHWEDFKVAREYIRSLKLPGYEGWEELVSHRKLHGKNIPSNPDVVYKHHGWKDWDDWLGTGGPQKAEHKPGNDLSDVTPGNDLWSAAAGNRWMNFFEAREIVRSYGFEYREEWELLLSGKFPRREPLPENIPCNPDQVYRHVGWNGWKDWLVSPEKQVNYTDFRTARDFVRSNRIPNKEAWAEFLREKKKLAEKYHMVLPARPHLEYMHSGWVSWEDWLGTEIPFRDFSSTRKFIRSLKLRNRKEWKAFCQGHLPNQPAKSENIYVYPEIAYRQEGWKDWNDWLGSSGNDEVRPESAGLHEITLECRCKGKLKHCPVCDGKGFYTRKI